MKGPRPTPTKLKLIRGNPGRRPLNGSEPRPKAAMPECPPHLDDEAKREWNRIASDLLALGLLSTVDRAALAGYAQNWSRWAEAETKVRELGMIVKSPTGFPVQNPFLSIANRAMVEMRKFLVEFGLTPSSRTRLRTPDAAPAGDDFDEFAKRA